MIDKSELDRRLNLFNRGYWEIPDGLDTSNFDFNWRPEQYDRPYIHQFGTQWQKTGGPRFIVPENEGVKYQAHQRAIHLPRPEDRSFRTLKSNVQFDYSWHPDDTDPPYIYVFGNQWYDSETMPTIQYRVKGATDKKYMTDVSATLLPDINKFELLIDDEIDFDYSWIPHPHEPPLNFIFGNQLYDSKIMPTVRYIGTLPDTKHNTDMVATIKPNPRKFKRLESIDDFDYAWRPNPVDPPYNYIFGNQYHSPEFMPTLMYRVKGATETKYIDYPKATLSIEKVTFEDTIFDAILDHKFTTKYVHFQNSQHPLDYSMVLYQRDPEREYAHIFDSCAILPNVKRHLVDKLSDYPYCITDNLLEYRKPLDIIFISNGESCAEENYDHLLSLNLPNRVVRVDKIDGRVASQHTAANLAETPWYFLVNAKLKVNEQFDFSWQPNIMQSRRHYIFKAHNPINGLEYGHMSIVANNKKLTLNTKGYGLDFTMDSTTEVVDMLSGTAVFNSEWDVWRTTFRECIKLKYARDSESNTRLTAWTTMGQGEYGQVSMNAALDAIQYFEEVKGELDKLKLSYDWAWLKDRYAK